MTTILKSSLTILVAICVISADLGAQTAIKLPKNKYTPKQDVQLGLEAAAEVRKQYPVIQDEPINKYLSALGERAGIMLRGRWFVVHTQ